jgi:transposase
MQQTLQDERYENGAALYMALELSKKYWKLGFRSGARHREVTVVAGDRAAVVREIGKARQKFGLAENCRVVSGYEAGRDGFWIHRWLMSVGIDNRVMDASSFEVARRARQAKTDRIDLHKLVELLVSEGLGDLRYRKVRVPSEAEEARRRPHRERETLLKEQSQHRSRLSSLLATQGITMKLDRHFLTRLEDLTDWQGRPLDREWLIELRREWQRLALVEEQLKESERAQRERLKRDTDEAAEQLRALRHLKGLDLHIPCTLVHELFWRRFRNGREVGGIAGLTPTPYASGELKREQGISKHGIARVRRMAVELAWLWVRYQPNSAITKWFEARFARGGKRSRRVGIVAVARKLLIALWRYLETGVVPEGAIVKA